MSKSRNLNNSSRDSMRNKLMQTKTLLSQVFLHEPYYLEATLACFASRANLCLLGFRGSGKTHLMECLIKTIDSNITAIQQGYLSAELEDVFARPDIAKLTQGQEEVVFKKMVYARVKGFDEIQRLGVGALSAMFRLLTTGTVMYMDREEGVKPFWVIATANPTELSNDVMNIRLPEPLWDRFDGVLWVPIAKLKYLQKINGKIERLKEALPVIWKEEDLLKLWKEVEEVKVSEELELIITLMNRIMGYCKYAQDNDASSLTPELKRELCGKCSKSYTCSLIARPPSVRAKLSLIRIAKGFAYLRGANEVSLEDVEKAFPLVYWKRIELMDENMISDRLKALRDLFNRLREEIIEVKEGIDLLKKLKKKFNGNNYERLKRFVNAKGWFAEVVEELDDYYNTLFSKIKEKWDKADDVTKAKLYLIAKTKLPPEMSEKFSTDIEITVELNAKNIAKLLKVSKAVFERAKECYEKGVKEIKLSGEDALKWVILEGD
ncbi:MAG: AAA family ATPase [Candidatus Nezhaarchaeales archaeon]